MSEEQGSHNESRYTYRYPRPAVTVDVAVFAYIEHALCVLLVQRQHEPFAGDWALPGGFVEMDEDLTTAAQRELAEETNLREVQVEQMHTFGAVHRDPRGRVISVAHLGILSRDDLERAQIRGGSDAATARWWDMTQLPELAFDHAAILAIGLDRLCQRVREGAAALRLLPSEFTLADAQRVHEVVLGIRLDERTFRRDILATGVLE